MSLNDVRKCVLFVVPSMEGGGAERNIQLFAELLPRDKYLLKLACFTDRTAYCLPRDIEIIDLGKRTRSDIFRLVFRLAALIKREKPDTVLSSLTYANLISAMAVKLCRKKPRLVLTEHNNTSRHIRTERYPALRKSLIKMFYRYADRIICVSNGVRDDLVRNFGADPDKTAVIHNPVSFSMIDSLKDAPVTHQWFDDKSIPVVVAVGRLHRQKGFDYLLRAFRLVIKNTDARLIIIGDGPERDSLMGLTVKLGLKDRVHFAGFVDNPFAYIKNADLLVMSSLWEGFGNVILEAFVCGTAVVATDCEYGPGEIITDGVTGRLVKPANESSLSNGIIQVLSDRALRERTRHEGRRRAEDFRADKIAAEYEREL